MKVKASVFSVVGFVKRNPSILYSMMLLIVVPGILAGYAWWITTSFQDLMNAGLQRRAVLLHETVEVVLSDSSKDLEELKRLVGVLEDSLAGDLVDYTVLLPGENEGKFEPIAGFENELTLHTAFTQTQYGLTWLEDASFATVAGDSRNDQRILLVTRPLRTTDGERWGVATMALSLAEHDELLSDVLWRSSLILLVSVLVVLLLIANHARLFHYATALHKHEELDQVKDDFLSVASHELRTPITGLRSFLDLLKEGQFGELSSEGKKYIVDAVKQSNRLSALVDDMLDVSRIEQDRIEVSLEKVQVYTIVQEVIGELRYRAEEKGLDLRHAGDLKLSAMVDVDHLRRVIINLIGNAIKYTEKGEVVVRVEKHEGDSLMIRVQDTGIGIPPDKIEELFQKFSRVHTEATVEVQGTGLGLWITKALIEKMSGKIYISSIEGKGSDFSVVFPLAE